MHTLGDAHVYLNHVDALGTQLERQPRPFPTLNIRSSATTADIDGFTLADFELVDYTPCAKIDMPMAV